MEPILSKADNYSFLKKLVENVKETKDAQAPDDEEVNKVKNEDTIFLSYQFRFKESCLQLCSLISFNVCLKTSQKNYFCIMTQTLLYPESLFVLTSSWEVADHGKIRLEVSIRTRVMRKYPHRNKDGVAYLK